MWPLRPDDACFYGMRSGHAHRYQCLGDAQHEYGLCLGIGGVRVDRAVAAQILDAVAGHAVEAAMLAAQQAAQTDNDVRQSLERELEQANYEVTLASRRYEAVDPTKRLVARELESRWNATLERVGELKSRIARLDATATARPPIDRVGLLRSPMICRLLGMPRARTLAPSNGSRAS
jgi:hypothetical protein